MQTIGSWQIAWRLPLAMSIQLFLCCSCCSCIVHPRLWSFNFGSTKRSPGFLVLIFCFADCAARILSNGLWNGWLFISGIWSQQMKRFSAPICFSSRVLPRLTRRPWDRYQVCNHRAVATEPCWPEGGFFHSITVYVCASRINGKSRGASGSLEDGLKVFVGLCVLPRTSFRLLIFLLLLVLQRLCSRTLCFCPCSCYGDV